MRVVQLSTYDLLGGAARAALRLHRSLRAAGWDSKMLVRQKTSTDLDVEQVRLDEATVAQRAEKEAGRIRRECIEHQRSNLSNTFFSLPIPGYDLSLHPKVNSAHVLHLHWVAHFLSPVGISRLQALGKPVVWTLHDQRAFTGGCHFSAGCRGYETSCCDCPQLEPRDLPLAEAGLTESLQTLGPDLVVVCPSRWLADCARASALFHGARIEVIPYGVDTGVFRPERDKARNALGFAPGAVYLLAGADDCGERRKGFALLAEATRQALSEPVFRRAVLDRQINFLIFGTARPPEDVDVPLQWLGRFDSDETLARVYTACDAFLLPSTEDNLPNTMLESICCGTPVIGFDAGGIPEVIRSGHNGLLVPAGDTGQLAATLQKFVAEPTLRRKLAENCVEGAPRRFDLGVQARAYDALYRELTSADVLPASPVRTQVILPQVPLGPGYAAFYATLLRRARRERGLRHWRSFWRVRRDRSG